MSELIRIEGPFAKTVKWISLARSKDKTRLVLNGFGVSTIEGAKMLCAIDGARAHWAEIPEDSELAGMDEGTSLGIVSITQSAAVLEIIEGCYPNLAQVVPFKDSMDKSDMPDNFRDAWVVGEVFRLGFALNLTYVADAVNGSKYVSLEGLYLSKPLDGETCGPVRMDLTDGRGAVIMPGRWARWA